MATPGISIVIPAYNEEKFLPATLAAANEARDLFSASVGVSSEIVVVNNASTDKTEQVALAHGARVILHEIRNISSVRNAGIKAASHQIIITVDADSFLPKDGLLKVWEAMLDNQYIGGSFGVVFLTKKKWMKIIAPTFQFFVDLVSGMEGAMFFFWKDAALEMGGFCEERLVGEDSIFAMALRQHGKRTNRRFLKLRDVKIGTLDRKDTDIATLLSMFSLAFKGFLGMKQTPEELKYWYDPKR